MGQGAERKTRRYSIFPSTFSAFHSTKTVITPVHHVFLFFSHSPFFSVEMAEFMRSPTESRLRSSASSSPLFYFVTPSNFCYNFFHLFPLLPSLFGKRFSRCASPFPSPSNPTEPGDIQFVFYHPGVEDFTYYFPRSHFTVNVFVAASSRGLPGIAISLITPSSSSNSLPLYL